MRRSSTNSKKTRKTAEENEIVGANRNTKPRPSAIEQGFQTDKYKTYYSAWTPIIHSASNNQVDINLLVIEILRLFKLTWMFKQTIWTPLCPIVWLQFSQFE